MASLDDLIGNLGTADFIEDEVGKYVESQLRAKILAKFSEVGLQNRTGKLKRSIKVTYNSTTKQVTVGIIYYGVFLTFGVLGYEGNDAGTKDVEKFWDLRPKTEPRFKFTEGLPGWRAARKVGFKAFNFLPTEDDLNLLVNEFIKQYKLLTKA